jgi:hypothetical protein
MKYILSLSVLFFVATNLSAQKKVTSISVLDKTKKVDTLQASCGQCNFKMKGGGCTLAVKIKEKTYFVDGTGINDHGDAHSHDGFCEAVKTAVVQGKIVNDRFVVTYFKLLADIKN